jgi:hypothetical protein
MGQARAASELSAADEVNDLDHIACKYAMLMVPSACDDFLIDFDRYGPLGKPEMSNQSLHGEVLGNLAGPPVDRHLHSGERRPEILPALLGVRPPKAPRSIEHGIGERALR